MGVADGHSECTSMLICMDGGRKRSWLVRLVWWPEIQIGNVQGDPSGRLLALVDIKLKVAF